MVKGIPFGPYTQRIGRQLSVEVRVTSEVPPGRALDPALFFAYANDIQRNNESTIRLFVNNYKVK
jgi:hypothetical protein